MAFKPLALRMVSSPSASCKDAWTDAGAAHCTSVVVVGHTHCGGVNAAIAAASAASPAADAPLTRYLTPLVQLATKFKADNPDLDGAELSYKLTEASVKQQVDNIVETSVIQSNWKGEPSPLSGKVSSKVRVHGYVGLSALKGLLI